MNTRIYIPVSRGALRRFKAFSITPNRDAYMRADSPYGRNRKGLKRWLRERKSAAAAVARSVLRVSLGVAAEVERAERRGEWLPKPKPPLGDVRILNDDFDDDDGDDLDPMEAAMGECGLGADYRGCMLAGTEYCDFECPFNN